MPEAIRVLLIEDDPDDQTLISHLLSEAPEHGLFELRCAERLTTGCKLLQEGGFDVILLDLVLPGGVGIEAFAKLSEARPGVPVVVLTGLRDEGLAVKAVATGAQDYLVKGTIDGQLLKRSIRYAIERGRLRARLEGLLKADVDGKLVVDSEGAVRYSNPAAAAMLGEALGRPLPFDVRSAEARDTRLPAGRLVNVRTAPLEWEGGRPVSSRCATSRSCGAWSSCATR